MGPDNVYALIFNFKGNHISCVQQEWFQQERCKMPGSMDYASRLASRYYKLRLIAMLSKRYFWILIAVVLFEILFFAYFFKPMTMNDIYKEANFKGVVAEVYEDSILVSVSEDEDEFQTSDKISIVYMVTDLYLNHHIQKNPILLNPTNLHMHQ